MRLKLSGFVDGMAVPDRFSEAWLAVLPKGVEDMDAASDVVRALEVLRPLLLKHRRQDGGSYLGAGYTSPSSQRVRIPLTGALFHRET